MAAPKCNIRATLDAACLAGPGRRIDARSAAAHGKRAWRGPDVTTEAVVTEAAYLLASAKVDGALALQCCLRGGAVVKPWDDARAQRTIELMRKYADIPMDYAARVAGCVAEELGTALVWQITTPRFARVLPLPCATSPVYEQSAQY